MTQEILPACFSGRRYHAYNDWVKQAHGGRLQKVSIDAGFTCPNRDGTRGIGGCTFCNNEGFTPSYLREQSDIRQQIDTGIAFARRRYPDSRGFLAYFQSYSNTYDELDRLKAIYAIALEHPDITGLVIGTRPDCLPEETLDYLAELAKTRLVELEIGIESCDDGVLEACNRGHDFACTADAIRRAARRGLFITGHLLLGLPGETQASLLAGARALAQRGHARRRGAGPVAAGREQRLRLPHGGRARRGPAQRRHPGRAGMVGGADRRAAGSAGDLTDEHRSRPSPLPSPRGRGSESHSQAIALAPLGRGRGEGPLAQGNHFQKDSYRRLTRLSWSPK